LVSEPSIFKNTVHDSHTNFGAVKMVSNTERITNLEAEVAKIRGIRSYLPARRITFRRIDESNQQFNGDEVRIRDIFR